MPRPPSPPPKPIGDYIPDWLKQYLTGCTSSRTPPKFGGLEYKEVDEEVEKKRVEVLPSEEGGALEIEPLPDLNRTAQSDKMTKYVLAAAEAAEHKFPATKAAVDCFKPFVGWIVRALCIIGPLYKWLYIMLYNLYKWAPKNVVKMFFGVALCFFGGTYVASLAAFEAFRKMGGERTYADLRYVYEQAKAVIEAADKEGTADDTTPAELFQKTTVLAFKTIKEPGRLETAVGNLWSAYLAVLATLQMEFARTTALALGMAETIKFPAIRVLTPILVTVLGKELTHWVDTIINTTINLVCVMFAWYLQMVISAVYSGMRGGRMFALALFDFLEDMGVVARLPENMQYLLNADDSFVDEAIGYALAGAGIYTQITSGFKVPFPLDIALLPLTTIEWVLRYQITFGGGATSG
jgi:hypothetical protein